MSTPLPRFTWLGYAVTLVVILIFALSPAIAVGVVNATSGEPPTDLAGLMASWGVLGWLMLAPVVLGGMLFLLWMLALPIHLIAWQRKRRRMERGT